MVILDVLSNVAFRFEQEEGETYPPIKIADRYHMAGKIVPSSRDQLFSHLRKLQPLLDILRGEKIFLNPLPRYTHSPCCDSADHCVGIGDEGHAEGIVGDTVTIRKVIRDYLHSRVSKVWVPDTLELLLPDIISLPEKCAALGCLFAKDGVHLTSEGYNLLGIGLKNVIMKKVSASVSVSEHHRGGCGQRGQQAQKSFYWKGFISPVGSLRPTNMSALHGNRVAVKGRHGGFHPYRKK